MVPVYSLQAFRSWGQRKEMRAEKNNNEGWSGVGVRAKEGLQDFLTKARSGLSLSSSFASHSTLRTPVTG